MEVSPVFSAEPAAADGDDDERKQRRKKVYEVALKKPSSVTATAEKTEVAVVVGEEKEKEMGYE